MAETKKRAGRPRKIIPAGSSELTVTVPNEVKAYIEAQATMLDMPVGRLVRRAVELHCDLVPRLEQQEAAIDALQETIQDINRSLRVIGGFVARLDSVIDTDDNDSNDR